MCALYIEEQEVILQVRLKEYSNELKIAVSAKSWVCAGLCFINILSSKLQVSFIRFLFGHIEILF